MDLVAEPQLISDGVIGHSPTMVRIYKLAEKLSKITTSALIFGESGTGKENLARTIHTNSPRRNEPFVVVDCSGLSEVLAESELFGHVRGAFTDAVASRDGLIKRATKGTLFLKSVETLPKQLQGKMLEVLEHKMLTPLGGTEEIKLDLRVISASTKSLKETVSMGQCREDLYHRLSVIEISLPPLRNRKEDIPLFIRHCIRKHADSMKKQVTTIRSDAQDCLIDYPYTGNIAELEKIVEYAVALTDRDTIGTDDLPLSVRKSTTQDELEVFEHTDPAEAKLFTTRATLWMKN